MAELEAEAKKARGRLETERRVYVVQKGELDLAHDRYAELRRRHDQLKKDYDDLVEAVRQAAREERRLARAGEDEAERFFRFVRELVYLFDAEGFVPAAARLEGDDAVVAGERFDPLRHVFERQIKALTRHRFRLERGPDGVRAELVFDL